MAKTKALAVKEPVALEPWEERLAQQAIDERANVTVGLPRITVESQEFASDGEKLGRTIKVVIAEVRAEKRYYANGYVQGGHSSPDCYGFGLSEKTVQIHEAAPHKQHTQCQGCRHNAFGTADVGKGKACKDYWKLLVIAPKGADFAFTDAAKIDKRILMVSPASLGDYGEYVNSLRGLTPHGNVREAVTEIEVYPLKFAGHGFRFRFVHALPREAAKVAAMLGEASVGILTQPYPVIEQDEAQDEKRKKISKKLR